MTSLFLLPVGVVVGLGIDRIVARLASGPDAEGVSARPALGILGVTSTFPVGGGGLLSRLALPGATALLFALAGARYHDAAHLALVTAYIPVLLICASTDLMARRVPNAITYPAIVGALAVGLAMPGARWVDVVMGGVLAGLVFLVPALLTRGQGIGMGDVKLALFIGLALGLSLAPAALVVTVLLGGLVAGTLLVFGLRRRRDTIPYAPFLAAGALTVLLLRGAAFAGVA